MSATSFIAVLLMGACILTASLIVGSMFLKLAQAVSRSGRSQPDREPDPRSGEPTAPGANFGSRLRTAPVEKLWELAESATTEELCALLSILPLELSNEVVRNAQRDRLFAATERLDDHWTLTVDVVDALESKLAALKASETPSDTRSDEYDFVVREALGAKPDEEAKILAMIGPADGDLKRELLANKFLYSYLKYLPSEIFRRALDGAGLKERAETLIVLEPELASLGLDCYPADSEQRLLIAEEMRRIVADPRLRGAVEARRNELILALTERVRELLLEEPAALGAVLEAEARESKPS